MNFAASHDPLFDSAWLKWSHGVTHAQTLDADVEAFSFDGDRNPLLGVWADYNAKRHGFAVYPSGIAPVPSRWGLMLGDVANNYRCALDHLAWALVTRGRCPPSALTPTQAKGIYFPISETRSEFNAEIRIRPGPKSRLKLPGIRRADAAKVRRAQPYHYSPRTRPRLVLMVLSTLNNADKHRTVQPIWVHPTVVRIEITRVQDCLVPGLGWPRRKGPLEIDAEITFIRARKRGRKPHLDVEAHVTGEPSIENRIGVREWTARCAALIARLLREFSAPPQEVIDRIETFQWLARRAPRE